MANLDSQGQNQSMNTPPPPSMRTPLVSPMALQLSGFLNGDTIQVQGDAGDLQFSVQLNIAKKLFHEKVGPTESTGAIAYNPENISIEDSSFSSYVTPNGSEDIRNQSGFAEPVVDDNSRFGEEGDRSKRIEIRECIVTRLRSGVISPVTYYPPRVSTENTPRPSEKVKSRRRSSEKKIDVFERSFRRRSCPVKPCTSYAFFVMATWGVVKSSTFGETSKRIGQMWYKLSQNEKKLYQELALKDNARYKKQCKLLKKTKPSSA